MKQLRIHCFQHVSFEGPAYIKDWAAEKGHAFKTTRFYEKQALPAMEDLDFLIIMGGPMGVCEEKQHAWMVAEKAFIRSCIESGKSVLGICLGAQLIASAMGAPVIQNSFQEIGWFPLQKTEVGKNHPMLDGFSTEAPVFHWHGDTFGIPPGAKHLLKSEACVNQAFMIGVNGLALQFHLELTAKALQDLIENCGNELVTDAPFIQSVAEIMENTPLLDNNNKQLALLMEKLTEQITKQ
jgi:GMP synthase-like glutamine amidotransferase